MKYKNKDGIGDWDGNFGTATYVHQREMTAAEKARALAAQKRSANIAKNNANRLYRNRSSYQKDPYLRHQNYMANNFMDAARKRYQHMRNDPSGYQRAYQGGYSNNNNFYAPVDRSALLRMRHEDDWNRKRQGLNPRKWDNLF